MLDFAFPPNMESEWLKAIAPTFAVAGVQASWAVQIGQSSAHLRKLGLSNELLGLAWLAGPVTSLFVQPLVGRLSDRCRSRFGRRRPFMLGGALGMTVGLLLFSNSANIASLFGNPVTVKSSGSRTGLVVALLSFWLTDTFINVLQVPSRCLMAQYATSGESLNFGFSLLAAASGIGKVIGYLAGSFASRIEVMYGVTAAVALLLTILTCILTEDAVLEETMDEESLEKASPSTVFKKFFSAFSPHTFLDMPAAVQMAFLIQFCTYFSFMLTFVYGTTWSGKEVFRGTASHASKSLTHKAYETGIRVANRGLLFMASISIFVSMALAPLCRVLGVKQVWSASLFCLGACMMATTLVPTKSVVGVYVLYSLLSFPLAVAFTIPWTVASLAVLEELGEAAKHELGAHMGTFNASQALACLAGATAGGILVRLTHGHIGNVLAAGGTVAVVGGLLVWRAHIPAELEER